MNEAIVQSLLCLINHPDTRKSVHHFDIEVCAILCVLIGYNCDDVTESDVTNY